MDLAKQLKPNKINFLLVKRLKKNLFHSVGCSWNSKNIKHNPIKCLIVSTRLELDTKELLIH